MFLLQSSFILYFFLSFFQTLASTKKMSNSSSDGSNSLQHSLSSLGSVSSEHTHSPPPSPMHPPLLFPIHPLPPQVFILEEVASFNRSDEEGEDSKDLRLKAEEEAEGAVTTAFLDAPTHCRRR